MKYGQIAGSKNINQAIYRYFEFVSEKDQRKFVKKFREQCHDEKQVMHTFRELVLGAFLSSNGLNVEYERKVEARSPEWCILYETSTLVGIVELVNFHIDKITEVEIEAEEKSRKGFISYYPEKNDPNYERLYSHIQEKAIKYKGLIESVKVPYVVALYGDFMAAIDPENVQSLLFNGESALFSQYPWMCGVLYFEAIWGSTYKFTFLANPLSIQTINLPSQEF